MTRFVRTRRNAPALAGALLACATLLAACGGGKPAGGDPGGERLKMLSGDEVFAAVPDGATHVDTEKREAEYRKPGFSGGGWDGPAVIVTFDASSPAESVYRFYARRAEAAGWKPTASGSLGLTDRWAKTFDDGTPATLVLTRAGDGRYRLAGSAAAKT